MSAAYRPPAVDDEVPGAWDDSPRAHQGWLAADPGGGLVRVMGAAPAPATPSAFAHSASDNAGHDSRHMPTDDSAAPKSARSRPRSATVRRTSPLPAAEPASSSQHPEAEPATSADDQVAADPESSSDETVVQDAANEDEASSHRPTSPSAASNLTGFTALTGKTHGSGSSSGSGSTITQTSWPRRRSSEKSRQYEKSQLKGRRRSRSPRIQQPPGVLNYLDADSPNVTPEAIQRSVDQAAYWRMPDGSSYQSPSMRSTSSTASSGFQSDVFSELDHETDRSSSPDHSAFGDSPMSAKFDAQMAAQQRQRGFRNYGTPEMPRGNANLPHLPPNALQPRLPNMHQGHPKHLPRAEKLPLTGYELIASKLCVGDSDRSRLKPIYRRFEALNHRLLLHLQDELAELEEQLHRLDTADTQTRRMQNRFVPASRRQDALTAGELQWHKTDVLGKIGYKLGQYNHVLASFKDTQHLPSPDSRDVEYYHAYLANHQPIVDVETRFLDPVDDLVSLARPPTSSPHNTEFSSDELRTPKPRKATFLEAVAGKRGRNIQSFLSNSYLLVGAVTFAAAFLLPILTFAVIPGFVGRMAVVALVAVGVGLAVVQAGLFSTGTDRSATQAATEGLLVSGVYVGVMAVVAGIFG